MRVPETPPVEKPVPPSERVLLSEALAAELCSVSLPTFRRWVKLGLIGRVALPGGLRRNLYRRRDVEALADDLARRAEERGS